MMTGLDVSKTPSEVISIAGAYYYSFYRKIFTLTLNLNIMNILKFIESFSTEVWWTLKALDAIYLVK
jgi:hypothetical protein